MTDAVKQHRVVAVAHLASLHERQLQCAMRQALMRRTRIISLALGLLASVGAFAADTYKIDKKNGGKLYTTTAPLDVFAEPKASARKLASYQQGAIMAVIGEATGTGYFYVSPCNACDKGYVPKSEFLSKAKP